MSGSWAVMLAVGVALIGVGLGMDVYKDPSQLGPAAGGMIIGFGLSQLIFLRTKSTKKSPTS